VGQFWKTINRLRLLAAIPDLSARVTYESGVTFQAHPRSTIAIDGFDQTIRPHIVWGVSERCRGARSANSG
jgi:hypothetical protein